jgi:hypothetical protein
MVYVNGCRLTAFTVTHNGATTTVIPAADRVKNGDFVRVVQPAHVPTADELKYDPTAIDADPTVLKTYKVNMPYSFFEDRNEYGRVIKTRYYYWVKNKESAV